MTLSSRPTEEILRASRLVQCLLCSFSFQSHVSVLDLIKKAIHELSEPVTDSVHFTVRDFLYLVRYLAKSSTARATRSELHTVRLFMVNLSKKISARKRPCWVTSIPSALPVSVNKTSQSPSVIM